MHQSIATRQFPHARFYGKSTSQTKGGVQHTLYNFTYVGSNRLERNHNGSRHRMRESESCRSPTKYILHNDSASQKALHKRVRETAHQRKTSDQSFIVSNSYYERIAVSKNSDRLSADVVVIDEGCIIGT